MKFCSDFGSCYRGATDQSPPLSGESGSRRRSKEMVRSKSSGSSSSWRPKLAAISEDVVVRVAEEENGAKREGGSRKRSVTGRKRGSMGKSHSFSHGDEFIYRHSSMSMALPTFSATPFMF